ncbi:hypothetical protein D3C77_542640 [compost metagenome]
MHRRGHLVSALELIVSSSGHAPGNAAQFAAGGFQFAGIVLQAGNGVGEKIAQSVGSHGQAAKLILTVAGYPRLESPLTQLCDILDQAADRLDQAAIDQPEAEQTDQQCRAEHHQQP